MDSILSFLTKDLIDKAVAVIDKTEIPNNRKGTGYAISINNKNYPFKLLVTEAAQLVQVDVTSSDFSSTKKNRQGFEKLTGYPVVNLNKKMTFKNLKELVDIINVTLGGFCSDFQYKRKELLKMGSASNREKLFISSKDDRDWVINPGGGTELQYHLFLRDNIVGYGLGFNTQYVPFANKKLPVDYVKPFVNSFLSQPELQNSLIKNGFKYIYGDENLLRNLVHDEYVLIGKKEEVINNNGDFELSDAFFQSMISDLRGILYETYKKVIVNMTDSSSNASLVETIKYEEYIKLLKYKKQIILQGPPGTGKTYTAKKIAEQMVGLSNSVIYNTLTPDIIKNTLIIGDSIANASGKEDYYTILKLQSNSVELKSERSEVWSPGYNNIIKKYNELRVGIEPSNKNSKEPYELAVARHLFKTIKPTIVKTESNYTLVQFHPSYTYEDFVRGISAKSEGGHISYDTENKVLALLAEEANNNLIASKKDVEAYSKEEGIKDLLKEYAEKVQDIIDESEEYKITEAVSIVAVEEDAFRYTGKWKTSQRMKFKDLVSVILQDVNSRQDFKRLVNVSGLAKQHSTYFFKVIERFRIEFGKQIEDAINKKLDKPQVKNYVLIIDEINRANLPSVLGELIYALEYRGEAVNSMYAMDGDASITIPENLYIIGTMNTADRSVGHIDYAIKRRFAFVDVLPNAEVITNDSAKALFFEVSKLFSEKYLASDFDSKDVRLGHSYFLLDEGSDLSETEQLQLKLDYEILPILNEYIKDGLLLETANELIKEISEFEC